MTETLVRIDGVTKRFLENRTPAVEALTTQIKSGQVTGLVGPDGAGKTTLLRLIAGLLLIDDGTLRVCGYDPKTHAAPLHRVVAYMPQRFGLYEDLSVIENLELYADLRSVIGTERDEAFARLLSFTGLEPFTGRLAGALSGGMKQKLGLACALIKRPRLLLLDEPSVGVDPLSRRELWRLVYELVDQDIGVVWSTAYLDEAERCASVLLLSEGKALYQGPPQALTRSLEGRTFLVRNISGERRAVLARALERPAVIDGVIQGRSVRLVIGKGGVAPTAQDLGHRFGAFTAAEGIHFRVKQGEIFSLIGPNGAGKSTIFKMLCGLLRPTSGTARVVGLDLAKAPSQARARLGYMAQKFSLYGDLSVRQNLEFFAGVYGLGGRQRRDALKRMVENFALGPHLDVDASTLPLGFKQRLALACAVMHNPDVLFLDEPTSGVDPRTRREFWSHINAMVANGVTVMVTTHFLDEAEYCDRTALVYRGRIIATGAPDDLKERARGAGRSDPTLEDAFIALVQADDRESPV